LLGEQVAALVVVPFSPGSSKELGFLGDKVDGRLKESLGTVTGPLFLIEVVVASGEFTDILLFLLEFLSIIDTLPLQVPDDNEAIQTVPPHLHVSLVLTTHFPVDLGGINVETVRIFSVEFASLDGIDILATLTNESIILSSDDILELNGSNDTSISDCLVLTSIDTVTVESGIKGNHGLIF
jgi:hypothetical protein